MHDTHKENIYLKVEEKKKKFIFSLFKMVIETLSSGERGGTLPVIFKFKRMWSNLNFAPLYGNSNLVKGFYPFSGTF